MNKILGSITILMLALLGFYIVTSVVKYIVFDINCSGRLKRAADANTVELAKEELNAAIIYLEGKNITKGYTSIIYNTPDEDVGFFYKNLKASVTELENLSPTATMLEKSNMLIKLRETLLDTGQSINITQPSGIYIYPYNVLYCMWGWLSFILSCLFGSLSIFLPEHLPPRIQRSWERY